MRIERVQIKNFRNLANIDVQLLPSAVIVGENQAGKSNLLYALRLILDANMSHNDRQLERGDFWDGLREGKENNYDPMQDGQVIEASIEVGQFEDDNRLKTVLASALLQESPMRARLTYRFAPIDTGDEQPSSKPKYLGAVYGGENITAPIPSELRRYLHLLFLHALRDVESDIKGWRRSPLRALLETAAASAPEDELSEAQEAMRVANEKLNELEVVKDLGDNIGARLIEMIGPDQAVNTELAVAPDDPLRLIRNMKLFVDGDAHRTLSSASLGTLNVLYLALQELGLAARELAESDIAHVVMAIEEPEAHLHPHLQRLIFRRLLSNDIERYTTLVTTQSPHIASVADPRSLVVLRSVGGQTAVAAAHRAMLADSDWDDVARYLDATRAELVFARRVLLVEGFAEQVLIPRMAGALDMDLDKLGVSVCAIHGTHFLPYIRLCAALNIPWAVVTDGDISNKVENQGSTRAASFISEMGWSGTPADHGIFVGDQTFEFDMLAGDGKNVELCFSTLKGMCAKPSAEKIQSWGQTVPSYDDFMAMIGNAGGKGRYAQRLSLVEVAPPNYVRDALQYLEGQ